MTGIFIRYGPPTSSEEPWRAVEVPTGKAHVDILALVKSDDAFGDIHPIVKVYSSDPAMGGSGDAMVEVGTVSVEKLRQISNCVYVQRSGGTAADFTTVIPGPIKGPIVIKGLGHRLRVYNAVIDAFVAIEGIGPDGSESNLMIESVPLGAVPQAVSKLFRYSDHVDHKLAFDTHHTTTGHLNEASLHEEWSQSAIPSDRSGLESGKWKGRIRKGVPSVHRHFVLPSLLENCASGGRLSLEDALKWTYGWAPTGFTPAYFPTFGAQYIEALKESIPLLPSGWLQHKFILTCLAQQQPDILACPLLPAVVAYLLMVLTPNEAYVMASKMMQLSRRETVSTIRYLPLSEEATSSFVASAIKIASAEGLSKVGLEPKVLRVLFEDLGVAFFSHTFPHLFTLRILDMFVYEGIKILIRIFVGILRVYLPTLGDRDLTQFLIGGPSVSNSLFNTCTRTSFEMIVEEGFKISLSKNDISWSGTRPDVSLSLTRRELHHWPRLEGGAQGSKILGTNLAFYEHIYAYFPIAYSTIKRVFRASDDAWSIANLYARMSGQKTSSAIILVQLSTGLRVGVFTSEMAWKIGRSYTGSRTDFLFVIKGEGAGDVSIHTCANCAKENVLLCERDHLTIGEGPAFRISGDMHTATSAACPVFGSSRLWDDEASVIEVEVFHIE